MDICARKQNSSLQNNYKYILMLDIDETGVLKFDGWWSLIITLLASNLNVSSLTSILLQKNFIEIVTMRITMCTLSMCTTSWKKRCRSINYWAGTQVVNNSATVYFRMFSSNLERIWWKVVMASENELPNLRYTIIAFRLNTPTSGILKGIVRKRQIFRKEMHVVFFFNTVGIRLDGS